VLLVTVSIALDVLGEADIGLLDLIIRLTLIGCIQLILIKIFEVLFLLARLALRTVVNGTPALMLGDVLRQSAQQHSDFETRGFTFSVEIVADRDDFALVYEIGGCFFGTLKDILVAPLVDGARSLDRVAMVTRVVIPSLAKEIASRSPGPLDC
jgi:hypothetical protein